MKKIFLSIPVAMILSACGTPSVEDLVKDPLKLSQISGKCQMLMMQGESTDTEECKNADEAQKIMVANIMKGMKKKLGQ